MTGMGYSFHNKKPKHLPTRLRARGANIPPHRPTPTTISPRYSRAQRVWQSSRLAQAGSLSLDPVGFASNEPQAPYRYSQNNPVGLNDPSGEDPCAISFNAPFVDPSHYYAGTEKRAIAHMYVDASVAGRCCGGGSVEVHISLMWRAINEAKNECYPHEFWHHYIEGWRKQFQDDDENPITFIPGTVFRYFDINSECTVRGTWRLGNWTSDAKPPHCPGILVRVVCDYQCCGQVDFDIDMRAGDNVTRDRLMSNIGVSLNGSIGCHGCSIDGSIDQFPHP